MAGFVYFTDEQKQRANEVDLEDFLSRQGEKLLRSGREKRLASDHSITVRGNRWYDHKNQTGGYPVKFLQEFYGLGFREAVRELLDAVHQGLYDRARRNLEENTFTAGTWEEVKDLIEKNSGGFVHTKWCGDLACEEAFKEKAGVTSRCMPLDQSGAAGKCPVCGKECTTDIIWGVAY